MIMIRDREERNLGNRIVARRRLVDCFQVHFADLFPGAREAFLTLVNLFDNVCGR